jgi:hypothetical protein
LAGGAVAVVEATAGWAVSAAIGPGQIEDVDAAEIVGVLLGTVLVGALFGKARLRLAIGRRASVRLPACAGRARWRQRRERPVHAPGCRLDR